MRLSFLLRLAFLQLFTQRLRTGLTVGGIGVSVGVMVFLLGVGNGLQHIVTSELSQSDSQRVVSVSSQRSKQLKLNQTVISRLTSISGVSQVEQIVGLSGRLTYHGISLDLPVYAVTAGYFDVSPYQLVAGEPFRGAQEQDSRIMVSSVALQALGIPSPKDGLGKHLAVQLSITQGLASRQAETTKDISGLDYRLVGILDKGTTPVAYIPAEGVFSRGVDVATEAKVVVSSPDKITSVRKAIEQQGFQTSSIRDTIDQVNQIFAVIRTILIIFGVITLVIAVFGTLNTITITLVEQTRQIGFLRLIGIRQQDVGMLFLMQSVMLTVFGVLIGIGAGVMLGQLANGVVYYLSRGTDAQGLAIYEIPLTIVVLMLVASAALGWLIGAGPARRAVRLKPLDALRM